jgi:peptidoglycan/xylan/chitin deacetylase (PgdA/CDA1 family)
MSTIAAKNLLKAIIVLCLTLTIGSWPLAGQVQAAGADNRIDCPILLYHRFGPVAADSMTTTTQVFLSQLEYLKTHGYTVVPLRSLVDAYLQKGPAPPAKSVVITVDDGHISVYTEMLPIALKYQIPITLFIYPSAIGNAAYAMSWEQLRDLGKSGLFDIQAHTYWHPNFKIERRRLSPSEYEKFVDLQLTKTKTVLAKQLAIPADMVAWPFGIYDDQLLARAAKAGYLAGFTIEARHATNSDQIMKLPRYLLTNANQGKDFEWIFINAKKQ